MSPEADHSVPEGASADSDWGPLSSLPGNPMIWILIIGELLVFGAFFLFFAVERARDPATFDQSQLHLDRTIGAANTLVLITSGWLAALGARAEREGRNSRPLLLGAATLGVLFLVIKAREYAVEIGAGFTIDTNTFFSLYYLLTGFHAAHVFMGVILLAIVAWLRGEENVETGCAVWHMVDLIWVILYPLVYLIR
jgi:nitric oxide reductase NorE protein